MIVTGHHPAKRLLSPKPPKPDPPLRGHGPTKGRRVREYPEQTPTAAPCAICNTTGGKPHNHDSLTPGRKTGRRFGIEGRLCLACYGRLMVRRKRQAPRARSEGAGTNKEPNWTPTETQIDSGTRRHRALVGELVMPPILNPRFTSWDLCGRALTCWLKGLLRTNKGVLLLREFNDGLAERVG